MKLKGIEKFREKTQIFGGWKIWLIPLVVLLLMATYIKLMTLVYSLPDLFLSKGINSEWLAIIPLAGEVVFCTFGLILIYQMWAQKDRLKKKYGQLSYKYIFFVGFTGVTAMISVGLGLFVHYWIFSPSFWADSSFKFLAIPLDQYFITFAPVIFWAKMIISVLITATGIALILRALFTFGFDYMTVVYLYFPEESKIQNHEIYSVLRHPTYAGLLLVALGGMYSTLTLYSVILYIVFFCALFIHIHYVEEKELIQRFGQSYKEYMKNVPAVIVRPAKIRTFFKFLFYGN